MTRAARIPQADITRAIRAARAASLDSRVIIDLTRQRIEITFGSGPESDSEPNPWEQDHAEAEKLAS